MGRRFGNVTEEAVKVKLLSDECHHDIGLVAELCTGRLLHLLEDDILHKFLCQANSIAKVLPTIFACHRNLLKMREEGCEYS
jgi:hypothetical protein